MAIYFSNKNKTFYLQTKDTSYVFRVNEQGFLQHLYFGPKIYTDDLGHTEYLTERQGVFLHNADNRTKQINQYHLECASFAGRGDYKENMLTINNDGSRLSDFKYCGFKIIEDLKLNHNQIHFLLKEVQIEFPVLERLVFYQHLKILLILLKSEY